MKIIILTILLTGCAGFGGVKEITLDNAEAECRYFGVIGTELKEQAPDFTVNIVGDNINKYCPTNGCLHNGRDIYVRDNDWLIIGHEKCHGLFINSKNG